ncbi:MAG: hypothetical protein EA412_00255 [Chitinophagaceae bacterium]|nr:MAG: hypothetical protein EA412_00255 [Chitinophagaceae bacterium]
MHNITVISSFHNHLGKCNPDELYRIIEEIQPEIIFEELCLDTFSRVYADGSVPNTIEAIAIKKYLRKYPVKHFPVDTYPINESDFFNGADEIAKRSSEYLKLWNEKVSMITKYGYDFLNSNDCIELIDKIKEIEETVLSEINDVNLSREYESERILHNNREYEMLKNIYDFSKQFNYNKATFICGTKHRKALKLKIKEYETKEKLKLNWAFYNEI